MKKKLYETPTCTVIHVATEHYLLGESGPKVQPGGGNNGHVTICLLYTSDAADE